MAIRNTVLSFTPYQCMKLFPGELYTSEKLGSEESGDGSQEKPFKSIIQVS